MANMKDEDKKEEKIETKEPEVDTDPGDDLSSEALAEEEFVFEDNTEVTGADYKQKTDKLRAQIKELQKKNAELLDGWQRDKAEFINARKRDEEQKNAFLKFSKEDLISELLMVLDSFESAFKDKEAWEKADKNWRTGVEYIHSQFMNVLAQNGLKVINPVGELYNNSRDEAVETVKVDDKNDGDKILDVVRVGYELNGKLIRAPKVKVGKFE